jgi:voltage-gated potassium channel
MLVLREKLDRYLPLPMFLATLLFLVLLGIVLHVRPDSSASEAAVHCGRLLWALYPLFVAEFAVHVITGSPRWRQHLLFCLLPPLRLAARDAATGKRVWLPASGWVEVNERLERGVARIFSGPMILIALAMVPLLALEFIWEHVIHDNAWIEMIVDFGTAVIWAAFTVEFVVMVSIVKKRLGYCKDHWIDLAIILAPMLAFARLFRLGRLLRLQTVARTTRVYRLRGLATRAYRAIFFVEIIQKVFQGKPEKRLVRLQERLAEKRGEVRQIEEEIARVRAEIVRREAQRAREPRAAVPEPSRVGDETVVQVDRGAETVGSPHGEQFAGRAAASPAVTTSSGTANE